MLLYLRSLLLHLLEKGLSVADGLILVVWIQSGRLMAYLFSKIQQSQCLVHCLICVVLHLVGKGHFRIVVLLLWRILQLITNKIVYIILNRIILQLHLVGSSICRIRTKKLVDVKWGSLLLVLLLLLWLLLSYWLPWVVVLMLIMFLFLFEGVRGARTGT